MPEIYALILAGLIVGFAIGATGVGGGALMTPALLLLGVPPHIAVGTDLLFAAGTKAFGVTMHKKVGTVKWRIVALLGAGSVPASIVTSVLLAQIGVESAEIQKTMMLALACAIGITSLAMLLNQRITLKTNDDEDTPAINHKKRDIATVASGVLLGVLVTLSSVGAGVIGAVILLTLYPRIRAAEVVGTDLAHAVPLTLIAGIGHSTMGTVNYELLAWLCVGSLPGIYLGTKVGLGLPDRVLRPILVGLLLLISVVLFAKALTL